MGSKGETKKYRRPRADLRTASGASAAATYVRLARAALSTLSNATESEPSLLAIRFFKMAEDNKVKQK